MPPSTSEVGPEHLEPVIVLILGGIRLAVLALEEGEVVVVGEDAAGGQVPAAHHLPDQRVLTVSLRSGVHGGEREEREEDEKRERAIHVAQQLARQTQTIF